MDQAEFEALMARLPKPPPQPASTAANKPAPRPGAEDQSELDLLRKAAEAKAAAPVPATGEVPEGYGPGEPNEGFDWQAPTEPGLGDPTSLDAIAGGALKGVFETTDFLTGETPQAERSALRKNVEKTVERRKEQSLVDGFAAGIGQFAVGMIGLGKASRVAQSLPWFGKGLGAMVAAAPKTAEAVKAATVGAVAFDPHEERLSNLIQDTPLAGPVFGWLAADPSDTAAEGRVKAALESIGLDAAILGVFLGSTKVWKALRQGNAEGASRLVDEMQAAQREAAEAELAEPGVAPAPGAAAVEPALPAAAKTDGAGVAPESQPLGNPTQAAPEARGEASRGDASHLPPEPQSSPAGLPESGNGIATGDTPPPAAGPGLPHVSLADEETSALIDGMSADAAALNNAGGWYQAIEAGHTFGRGEGIPYRKLAMGSDLDDFMARVVDTAEERLNAMRGGKALPDAKVDEVASQLAALFNANPAQFLGMVHQAGDRAAAMVANMEAAYLVSNRMLQDTYALATRIRLGDYVEFGSRQAALDALKHRLSLAASVYGAARSMTAASGRAMRRMRGQFAVDPATVEALSVADPERMVQLLGETEGNPKALARLVAAPSLWAKTKDFATFLYVNSLVSGPKTQLINMVSNGYMVAARPLERALGSAFPALAGDRAARGVFKQSLRQYVYLGAAFADAFGLARRAFLENDSILAPHRTEAYAGNKAGARALGDYRAWDSPGSLLHNALVATLPAIGLPTRVLGFTDELAKQLTYRSKVLAAAHEEALAAGAAAGLSGKALRDHVRAAVRQRLDNAFDAQGRGTDAAALREAETATFQNELGPKSFGRWMQTGADNFFPLRVMLPFVKTPTNILRYGWKMTPGLNMVQKEYREALLGKMGAEAQAQATGQMMLGGLFMGTAAYLVSQGTITGGGPKDYRQRQELMATGWQPYSVVIENEDGSRTYVPFGRLDPAVIPFGIMADLMDAIHALDGEEPPELGAAIGGLLVALSKQFADRSYLMGVSQALDALSDPERSLGRYAGQTVANFIPFSAALRQLNPDPHIRDARDIADKVLATIPGFSESLPARRDAWGDPVQRVGLWSSDGNQVVDREMQRLILESGSSITTPQPVHNGVDLREITLSHGEWAGRNAFEVYQELAGHPPAGPSLKELVAKRIQSEAYQLAPDGAVGTRGTKLWLLHVPVEAYRERAMKMLKRDPVVRDAFRADDLKARAKFLENRAKARGQGIAPMQKIGKSFGLKLD